MTRLHRVSQTSPGYTRRRHGRGFVYLDEHGHRISNGRLRRIRSLAIPPAWQDVWICPDEHGHLQATGTDDAGRRQYLYHDEWRRRRDRQKFHRIERFAEELPRLRRRVVEDLRGEGPTRNRVLACAVRLLDRGLFRVGYDDYTQENGSYGLSTLQKEHVTIARDHVDFDFIGKAGKRQIRSIRDPELLPLLRTLRRRRNGDHAFLSWRDADGWHPVRAADINAYVKAISGDEFSSKDFRTWHATVLAAVLLAEGGPQHTDRARKRSAAEAARGVSEQLGNTPAVARRSYIDPRVIDRFYEGDVIDIGAASTDLDGPMQQRVEAAVRELLRPRDTSALPRAA